MTKRTSTNHTYFTYWSKVLRVIDGDTIEVRCDLGLYTSRRITVRVDGVDTSEMYGKQKPRGKKARRFVKRLLKKHKNQVTIKTKHSRSFDRWVADVYLGDSDVMLKDVIIEEGYEKQAA